MQKEHLAKHFNSMGARIKFRSTLRLVEPTAFTINIQRDKKGEYFDFETGDNVRFRLLQAKPKSRHLLLLSNHNQERYLCGHDERHWFVAAIADRVSTVDGARRSLLPETLRDQLRGASPKEVARRRGGEFKRQGEWFFVPSTKDVPEVEIHKNEPIQRDMRSKPHVCSELYREGGELVHRVSVRGSGMLTLGEDEYRQRLRERGRPFPVHVTMIRNPDMYARGVVRHDDHAPLKLDVWHRVYVNGEFTASTQVEFFD